MKKTVFLVSLFLFSIYNIFAQARAGARLDLTTGYVHTENEFDMNGQKIHFPLKKDNWITSADVRIKIDTDSKSIVKAYIDTDLALTTVPESDFSEPGILGTYSLNKAYLKVRLPWFFQQESRLTAGKMPLNWGFGMYYNAGDLIFGADPNNSPARNDTVLNFTTVEPKEEYKSIIDKNTILSLLSGSNGSSSGTTAFSSSSLSDFRTSTDWMATYYMPFGTHSAVEAVSLFPFDTELNSKYGRIGTRALFFSDFSAIQQLETGYISTTDFSTQKAYVAFDGYAWLDYNLCSSISWDCAEGFLEKEFNISFSLTKIFNIQTDVANHSLQLKTESLITPFDNRFQIFGFISYEITDTTSLAATYLYYGANKAKTEDNKHTAALSFSWEPTARLEFSIQALLNCSEPKNLAAVLTSFSYRY